MMTRYGIPTFVDVHDFVSHLARRMGKLKKGAYKTIFLVFLLSLTFYHQVACLTSTRRRVPCSRIGTRGAIENALSSTIHLLLCFVSYRGQIKFYTHPPEARSLPTHLSAEVVTQWSKEFDWVRRERRRSRARACIHSQLLRNLSKRKKRRTF